MLNSQGMFTELEEAQNKISFLEMEQAHLRECLNTALASLNEKKSAPLNLSATGERYGHKALSFIEGKEPADLAKENKEREAALLKIKSEIEGTRFEIATLKDQILHLKRQNQDLETNNLALFDSYKASKDQLVRTRSDYEAAAQQHQLTILSLKEARASLEAKISFQKEEHQDQIAKISSEAASNIAKSANEVAQLKRQADLHSKSTQTQFEQMRKDHHNELHQILSKNEDALKTQKETYEIEISRLEKVINTRDSENNELHQKVQEAYEQIWKWESQFNAASQREAVAIKEKGIMEFRLAEANHDLAGSAVRQKRLNELIADQNKEIDRLNSMNVTLSENIREKQSEINDVASKVEGHKSQIDDLLSQKNDLNFEIEKMKSAENKLKAEIADLQTKIQNLERNLDSNSERADVREKQYRFYLENLNRAKKDVREQGMRLIQEMRVSKQMSPLKDFLKITSREILRVEMQLKRTPTISADRSRLEQCLTDLIEQKEFLTLSLERSSSDLDNRVAQIAEILGGEAITMMPPPPPPTEQEI